LPRWPIERLRLRAQRLGLAPLPPDQPVALVERAKGALRLAALDARAEAAGLHPGQLLADARALAPDLVCADHDPAAEAAALARFARWCGRWSPDTAPARQSPQRQGVFLEVSGSAHLFGGEAGLLADLLARTRALGLTAAAALADTPGAAWALAVHAPQARGEGVIAAPGAGLRPLLSLPAAGLRLAPELMETLRAVGLRTIGEVARQNRASLARRFGPGLLERLDQAAGRAGEPIRPLAPPVRLAVARRFAEPLLTLEAIERVAAALCVRLAPRLVDLDAGARRLALRLYRVDGEALQIAIGASRPEQEPARLARLFQDRLAAMAERLDLGFGVDAAELIAIAWERIERRAQGLDPGAVAAAEAEARTQALSDRLAARLGEAAVRRLQPQASHLPERAQAVVGRDVEPGVFDALLGARRPMLLFEPPEPIEAVAEVPDAPPRLFRWRRTAHQVARAEGPERIGAEWWALSLDCIEPGPSALRCNEASLDCTEPGRKAGRTRDYYRVETREGRRFWLYREGLYGEGEEAPRWFLHGSFG